MATLKGKRFITFGVPFFVLIIGGSFCLKNFQQVRYEYRSQKPVSREEVEEMGVKMKAENEVTIEKQFKNMQNMDIDTWENKRGPRPWEKDNPTVKEIQSIQQKQKAHS